jgi:1-acyl-sn-glycerol-3-phosphate acyltransferase
MTPSRESVHLELPRSIDVPHPAHLMLHGLRPAAAAIVRRRWHLTVRGAEHVPAAGPVVIAANHIGFMDGPLMAIVAPRPVHVLAKHEMYHGSLGAFLNASGQIAVQREGPDPSAVKIALRVLRDGGTVGVFPEGTRGMGEVARVKPGAAYLAMAAGAHVVPLVFLGTRLPGGSNNSVPPSGSRFVMSFGPPIEVAHRPWPRRQPDTHALSERIRVVLRETLDEAVRVTGMALPGPIGGTDEEVL